jgi:methylmalonyl-CoA mutase, N-terminal domain
VLQTLKDLEKAAREEKNVMPYLLECCSAYATVGEMTRVFKEVFGEFKEPSIF